jgi:hypothetical protein
VIPGWDKLRVRRCLSIWAWRGHDAANERFPLDQH